MEYLEPGHQEHLPAGGWPSSRGTSSRSRRLGSEGRSSLLKIARAISQYPAAFRKLIPPCVAYGRNDALAAFRNSLRRYLLGPDCSSARVGLKFQVSSFDPYLYFALRRSAGAVGALTTHLHDILGCGGPGISLRVREKCGAPLCGAEGSGTVLRTRGNGSAPGQRFLCSVDPGRLYGVAQTHSDCAGRMGVSATSAVVRRN